MKLTFMNEDGPGPNFEVFDMTVIGCSLSIVNQTALVDSKSKRLVSVEPVSTKTKTEWLTWKPPPKPTLDPFGSQLDTVSGTEAGV
jgi:hypothetical protein